MLLCLSLLVCSASLGALAKSTPQLPRRHVDDPTLPLRDSLPEPDNDLATVLVQRDRRAINSKPSDIYWIFPRLSPTNSKLVDEDSDTAGENAFFSKIFNIKRRSKRAFPSSDDVSDADVAQWTRKAVPKSDFITGREHRTDKASDGGDTDAKNNEVEPGFRPRSSHQPLTNRDFGVDSREGERFRQPHRRIIYYANLPEITSRDRSNVYGPHHRRYEPVPAAPKYPRESSYEARGRSNPLSFDRSYDRPFDRYNYRPADQTHSYTIVDAEVPRSNSYDSPYPAAYQGLSNSKYNKIPAPYRQGDYPTRPREPLGSQGATLVRNEPYRDYNPRQPAPWSVQIGTKLTVKDDGRPFRPDVGQRRFYVNSQEPPRYNRVDRSRYDYSS